MKKLRPVPDLPPPVFEPIPSERRPHDASGVGKGWTFTTLEHDEHTFPEAIEATDAEGRSCIYVPPTFRGKIGRWS